MLDIVEEMASELQDPLRDMKQEAMEIADQLIKLKPDWRAINDISTSELEMGL